jgi:hypothetical protein
VQIFSPCRGSLLQTIADQEPGAGFGSTIAPMGDLNGDGYLDLAVGAPGHAGGEGRVYLMKSDGTVGPFFEGCATSPGDPGGGDPGGGSGGGATGGATGGSTSPPVTKTPPKPAKKKKKAPAVATLAKRRLSLTATKKPVKVGAVLTLRGRLVARVRSCRVKQKIAIQRLGPDGLFLTINVGVTARNGKFASSTRPAPAQTFFYRARVSQTKKCKGAVSHRVKVVAKNAAV